VRIVAQRVSRAEVRIDGRVAGSIGAGLLVLAGFAPGDGEAELAWMADKLWGLRVFPDAEGRMNRSLADAGGALLVVSQFTLYGDVSRGRRPSFIGAAEPGEAERLYERFLDLCRGTGAEVESGEFGAMMEVELVNDGPVTLIIDREGR
jgi:D-tyrosyl-tRNA(Tyr) deacylase